MQSFFPHSPAFTTAFVRLKFDRPADKFYREKFPPGPPQGLRGNLGAAVGNMNRIRHWVFGLLLLSLALFGAASGARADNAAFDLAGPEIEMTVNRAGKTLPIAEVPNLHAGDRLWIHPVLPDDQSVHYLLVIAFLRGTTNPPPDEWFTRVETWNRNVRAEGILVNVPQDAQQALLFWPR